MSQQQLREAHELIEQGRINQARQLLQTLDDPTAKQWLACRRSLGISPKVICSV